MNHPIELLQLKKSKEAQFIGKGLTSVEDIAYFFPRKYIDFRRVTRAKDVVSGGMCAMAGTVVSIGGSEKRFVAEVREDTAMEYGYFPKFSVVWFGTNHYIKQLEIGKQYVFCGRVTEYHGALQIVSPLAFGSNPEKVSRIFPVYSKIKGMSTEYMLEQIKVAISYLRVNERVGEKELLAGRLKLMGLFDAIAEMHQPTGEDSFKMAQARMAFEAIYDFYADLKRKDLYLIGTSVQSIQKTEAVRSAMATLPFQLTEDQSKAVEAIIAEASAGRRLHTLISGDVGCGKTIVSILSVIFMWENGYQTMLMVPTLVLAQQHYAEYQSYAQKLGFKVGLLTAETKSAERRQLLSGFADGTLDVLIGTQAVLSSEVEPKNLALTIIDEEHKFGVQQKTRMEDFDKAGVHHISMTATPIPRSIAMAVYGRDLAVLPIGTMPQGRMAVKTSQCFQQEDAFEQVYNEVIAGRQAYIVCPFIEDSELDQFKNVVSVATAKTVAEAYYTKKPQSVRIGVISGDMKQSEILTTVSRFAAHELDVLVSTTIIEVGVNVPNASIIVIMSAERFGLAALHQLRGRVGRSSDQGYCLLCSDVRAERLDVLCREANGFLIAEQDMKLRGPGDLTGDAQTGDSQVIELIIKRPRMAQVVRDNFFQGHRI